MCKAKVYIEQLKEVYQTIDSDIKRLKNEEKMANLFDLDMLHEIENTNFNACQGYKLAKQIRENRLFRREIKNELDTLLRLKDNFLDANIELLDKTYQEIINRNNYLNELVEKKVYNPRVVMYRKRVKPKSTVAQSNPNFKSNPNFIPIPIPSTPPQIDFNITPITQTTIHKDTKEKLQVISKIDENHYVVKRKTGAFQVMLKKNILNLESLQLAQ